MPPSVHKIFYNMTFMRVSRITIAPCRFTILDIKCTIKLRTGIITNRTSKSEIYNRQTHKRFVNPKLRSRSFFTAEDFYEMID